MVAEAIQSAPTVNSGTYVSQTPSFERDTTVIVPQDVSRPEAIAQSKQGNETSIIGSFITIFGGNAEKIDQNNITLESLRNAGANVSKELFDLIDSGMKVPSERDSQSDGKLTQQEIELFFSNVVGFMQLIGLDQSNTQDLVRTAQLYNKSGGNYVKISISEYEGIKSAIDQQWIKLSGDPYQKAIQILGSNNTNISLILDKISQRLKAKDFKDIEESDQKTILTALILSNKINVNIFELYGIEVTTDNRSLLVGSTANDSSVANAAKDNLTTSRIRPQAIDPTNPIENNPYIDNSPIVFTLGDYKITKNIFEKYFNLIVNIGSNAPLIDGRKISELSKDEQTKIVLASLMNSTVSSYVMDSLINEIGESKLDEIREKHKDEFDKLTNPEEKVKRFFEILEKEGLLDENKINLKFEAAYNLIRFADNPYAKELQKMYEQLKTEVTKTTSVDASVQNFVSLIRQFNENLKILNDSNKPEADRENAKSKNSEITESMKSLVELNKDNSEFFKKLSAYFNSFDNPFKGQLDDYEKAMKFLNS